MTTAYERLRASVDRVMPIRPDDLIEVRAADVDALLTDYKIAIAERDFFSEHWWARND